MTLGIQVKIGGDTKELGSALDEAGGKVGGFGVNIGGGALKVAALAGAVGIAANVVADLTSAAAEDEAQQLRLSQAIAQATGSTADHTAEVEAAIAAGQDKAFTDSQTRDALQSLVTSTGDLTAATGMLTGAQDIARLANVDLATAADAVAKANEGQDGPLRKLIPGLEKGATAADTLALATAKAAGQADVYASSAEGMQAKGADAFGELGETIGSVFLPVIKEILPAILPVIKALGTIITALLPVLNPLLKLTAFLLAGLAANIAVVAQGLATVIKWITDAIGWIGRLVDSIGPLKGIGDFIGGITGGGRSSSGRSLTGRGRGARAGGSGGGAVTVNVYATGDTLATEAAVMRALRRETRLNGSVGPSWAPLGT